LTVTADIGFDDDRQRFDANEGGGMRLGDHAGILLDGGAVDPSEDGRRQGSVVSTSCRVCIGLP
jgi:hypothetical protein